MASGKTPELKRKYNEISAKNLVHFRLNSQEASLLERMMKEVGFINISGFIKYKLFGVNPEGPYKRMLRSGDRNDIEIVMKNLIEEMNSTIGYLNYKLDFELRRIEKESSGMDEKTARRLTAKIVECKEAVLKKTDAIFTDCQEILKYIKIHVEREKIDSIRFATDEEIEKASKDWNDTTSPEAIEAARRILEKVDKEIAESEKKKNL